MKSSTVYVCTRCLGGEELAERMTREITNCNIEKTGCLGGCYNMSRVDLEVSGKRISYGMNTSQSKGAAFPLGEDPVQTIREAIK